MEIEPGHVGRVFCLFSRIRWIQFVLPNDSLFLQIGGVIASGGVSRSSPGVSQVVPIPILIFSTDGETGTGLGIRFFFD